MEIEGNAEQGSGIIPGSGNFEAYRDLTDDLLATKIIKETDVVSNEKRIKRAVNDTNYKLGAYGLDCDSVCAVYGLICRFQDIFTIGDDDYHTLIAQLYPLPLSWENLWNGETDVPVIYFKYNPPQLYGIIPSEMNSLCYRTVSSDKKRICECHNAHLNACSNNPCGIDRCVVTSKSFICLSEDNIHEAIAWLKMEALWNIENTDQGRYSQNSTRPTMTQESILALVRELTNYIMMIQSEQTRIEMGYRWDEIVLYCFYELAECQWTQIYIPEYGNCFTINNNGSAGSRMVTVRPGMIYGLDLTFHTRPSTYSVLTESVGIKAALHNPNEDPFLELSALSVTVGYDNQFALSVREFNAIEPPYGDCVSSTEKVQQYFYDRKYTALACEYSYKQWFTIDRCNCSNPKWPKPNNSSYCGMASRRCVDEIEELDLSGELRARCNKECRNEIFKISSTKTKKKNFFSNQCEANKEYCQVAHSGIGQLHVYYNVLFYARQAESPAYTISEAVSDVGGSMGIAAGISVITLVELCILLWKTLKNYKLFDRTKYSLVI